jgi:hypothetical protein
MLDILKQLIVRPLQVPSRRPAFLVPAGRRFPLRILVIYKPGWDSDIQHHGVLRPETKHGMKLLDEPLMLDRPRYLGLV